MMVLMIFDDIIQILKEGFRELVIGILGDRVRELLARWTRSLRRSRKSKRARAGRKRHEPLRGHRR